MVSERVLIIDDEPKIGEFIAEVAVELGHSVQVTSKPSDFKCLVDSFEPTVIWGPISVSGFPLNVTIPGRSCVAVVVAMRPPVS